MLTGVITGSGAFRAAGERSFLHKKDGFTGKYVVQQRLKIIFCFSRFLSDSYSSWYVNAQIEIGHNNEFFVELISQT